MIEKIDIENFGCYSDFVWSKAVRDAGNNVAKFKRLNVLYGRNYSGKTTLSRIFRALETGSISLRYVKPAFKVTLSNGVLSQDHIPAPDHTVRVYNKDFVDEHLAFLGDETGHISPFAVLGQQNKELEAQIAALETELGSVESQTGLRHEFQVKKVVHAKNRKLAVDAADGLERLLIDKANRRPAGIKHNSLYRDATYDIRKLKLDIQSVADGSLPPLPEERRKDLVALLGEAPLPDVRSLPFFGPSLGALWTTTNKLITKKIQPSAPLQELLNNAILQSWVQSGIGLHRDKRSTCGFCGAPLPADLWDNLGGHFNRESTDLDRQIAAAIDEIFRERGRIDALTLSNFRAFYTSHQERFNDQVRTLHEMLDRYQASLLALENELAARRSNIFAERPPLEVSDPSLLIVETIDVINMLISLNNKTTASLADSQIAARTELRLGEIAQFVVDIGLAAEEKRIGKLWDDAHNSERERDAIETQGKQRSEKIAHLKTQLRDERRGAEQVNHYLGHFLGHGGLRLLASQTTSSPAYRFQIMRGEHAAYNLSEGECSLVAFCYFLAKLKDVDTVGKKPIVYIDDPISSLDSNHIFFVFSLIESYLAKPIEDGDGNVIKDASEKPTYRYEQLFISTHNLEFLKYLKRLTKPGKDNESFLVTRKDSSSAIGLMPHYLRNYVTELNYLFGEIYCCSDDANTNHQFHSFYNFGNNLRKFLEAFLFFKFPSARNDRADHDERVRLFFGDGSNTEAFLQRLINEFSHLGEFIDRSTQPIDCTEIASLAKFVLRKIRDNDRQQFDHFLLSIEKPDPFGQF
ncbi:AAA family ATPase [Robbsia sp. Bb-Pol-6]|uniref:AAA family ATPase n=1 Tax=Robbsia betulipollinis TaxID=2981849 RepID=A0ABT3ZTQ8_9BURK|nr:AAA family ATPase [Robbsia betulipollinis]MCY0389862.1 AAA family ATPase [Robbsia betulipollinis]